MLNELHACNLQTMGCHVISITVHGKNKLLFFSITRGYKENFVPNDTV